MIDVATLSVIRRWALREQLSIREVARRTGLSRNTVRKYLREGEAAPSYAKRISPSKIDVFAEKLRSWLKSEAAKSRKQRRTLKQMHADLAALGYSGSYNRVAAFARSWKAELQVVQQTTGRGTFVPLLFGPGEAFQFDWSEDWAVIGGERTKLQVAHFKLSHSRAFIVRAYSPRCSCTILTARSRTSGENLFDFFMAQSSQRKEPPQKPGRVIVPHRRRWHCADLLSFRAGREPPEADEQVG